MLLTLNIQNFKNKYLLGLVGQYRKRRKSWWFLFISSSISQSLEFNLGWNVLIICASPRWMCLALNALIMITPMSPAWFYLVLFTLGGSGWSSEIMQSKQLRPPEQFHLPSPAPRPCETVPILFLTGIPLPQVVIAEEGIWFSKAVYS